MLDQNSPQAQSIANLFNGSMLLSTAIFALVTSLWSAAAADQRGQASNEQVTRGAALFHSEGCQLCHAYAGWGGQRGPSLTNVGDQLSRD